MRARRRFAQHFLESAWVSKVAGCVGATSSDAILEVGPGRGALTMALAQSGATITAVELDRDLAAELRPRLPANVELVEADVLALDLEQCASELVARRAQRLGRQAADLPPVVRVAGNLPYNISTPLIARLVREGREAGWCADATVMVQLEVAERLHGRPGTRDYGPLSILAQTWADIDVLLRLPPGAFRPPPKVQSAVVSLRFRPARVRIDDVDAFEALVRSIFLQRRKTLGNALKSYAHLRGTTATAALTAVRLDAGRRPETLAIEELAVLAGTLAARPVQPG